MSFEGRVSPQRNPAGLKCGKSAQGNAWTFSTVRACENPGVLSEMFLRKAEGVTSGETSGDSMLGSTRGALREVRLNLRGLECISQM